LEAEDLLTTVSFEVCERRTEPPDLALAYILSSPSISILFYLVLGRCGSGACRTGTLSHRCTVREILAARWSSNEYSDSESDSDSRTGEGERTRESEGDHWGESGEKGVKR